MRLSRFGWLIPAAAGFCAGRAVTLAFDHSYLTAFVWLIVALLLAFGFRLFLRGTK